MSARRSDHSRQMTEAAIRHGSPAYVASLLRRAAMECVALAQGADDRSKRLVPTLDLIAEDLLRLSGHLSLLSAQLDSSGHRLANPHRPS